MNAPLPSLRRCALQRRGRLALLLLLVAPLCAAACGVHPMAADMATTAPESASHVDCHETAPSTDADAGDEAVCCEDQEPAPTPEREPSLPVAVIAFTAVSLEQLVIRSAAPPRPAPPDPGGRSPGRFLLLLIVSFLE